MHKRRGLRTWVTSLGLHRVGDLKKMSKAGADLVFNGRWTSKGVIGKGAFSEIYAAVDSQPIDERYSIVAVKFQDLTFDSSVMKWESTVLTDLACIPSVPKVFYYGHENGGDYMVMELLTGEDMSTLRDRVRVQSSSGLIPVEIASFLTRQMLRSLQAMHERGYVHRDVKASNFVRRSPSSTEFCMIDFGLAKSHRDSHGSIRPERDNAEFRGTTIYASPFVHSGHDQCPRDDLFSVLHVFLDFVLGDLPWKAQAKSKDKAAVAAWKTKLLEDPDKFLEDFVQWQKDGDALDAQGLGELRAIVERVRLPVRAIVGHLKELKFTDTPDYAFMAAQLQLPVDQDKTDAVVGDLSYTSGTFSWREDSSLEDRLARFSGGGAGGGTDGPGSHRKPRKPSVGGGGDRAVTDSVDNQLTSGAHLSSGSLGDSQAHESSAATGAAGRPLQLKLLSHGKREDYKLLTTRDKLLALQKEIDAALAAASKAGAPSSSQSATPSRSLGMDAAVRWKILAAELIRLPDHMLGSAAAGEAIGAALAILQASEHFFGVALGELDAAWPEFSDVQSAVASFYDFYVAAKQKAGKVCEEPGLENQDGKSTDRTEPVLAPTAAEDGQGSAAEEPAAKKARVL